MSENILENFGEFENPELAMMEMADQWDIQGDVVFQMEETERRFRGEPPQPSRDVDREHLSDVQDLWDSILAAEGLGDEPDLVWF